MPRSAADRWKDIEEMRRLNAETRKLNDELRKKNDEDREELKKWEESIKEVPVELRMAAQRAAARPKKYTFDEFKAYLKTMFNWKSLALITPFIVYGIYLMFWKQAQLPDCADEPPITFWDSFGRNPFGVQELDPNDPYAHCYATPEAACCANESVVDSVFAKAEAKKRRSDANKSLPTRS
jgi:hypothetical protein